LVEGAPSQVPVVTESVLPTRSEPLITGTTVFPTIVTAPRVALVTPIDPRRVVPVTVTEIEYPISDSVSVYVGEIAPEIEEILEEISRFH
jgi:hypothetical protein